MSAIETILVSLMLTLIDSLSVSGRVNDSHTTTVCVNKAKRIGYSGAKFLIHLVKTFGPLEHHEKKLFTS